MTEQRLPPGFLAAGRNLGIKNRKRDVGILWSERPATWAAVLTPNRCRAPNVDRIAELIAESRPIRAVLAVSGNANALVGPEGAEDDRHLAAVLARELDVAPHEVLTTYTGAIGQRLPRERIERGLPKLLAELGPETGPFSESILTTDRVSKVAVREWFTQGHRRQLVGVVKGAGMIAPALATMLGYVVTDAPVAGGFLQAALRRAAEESFNLLTVDNDMSTNDLVVALAPLQSDASPIVAGTEEAGAFERALGELCLDMARAIASDGEGANRRLEVEVTGAADVPEARILAKAVANSPLVKTALFSGDPNAFGRILSAAGAAAAGGVADLNPHSVALQVQGTEVFSDGRPRSVDGTALRQRLLEPVVHIALSVGQGPGGARALGCDLSHEYVQINADYLGVTRAPPDEAPASGGQRLDALAPDVKRRLLIDALRYIDRFDQTRAVIKIGGAAMVDPELERQFAESVLLLRNVGLLPIVVHGGGPEISRTLKALGRSPEFVDGFRVTDAQDMEVVEMVLTGRVNQRLVAALNDQGASAVGLSGRDGGLIKAKKIEARSGRDLGQVGRVESIDTSLIDILEREGYVPVISPVGQGDRGVSFNINADVVAARIASEARALKLIYLSDVPGLMLSDRVISELDADQLRAELDGGAITGGMKPKLESALEALRSGVASVHLVDGRIPHNLIAELFTDKGVGTLIRRS